MVTRKNKTNMKLVSHKYHYDKLRSEVREIIFNKYFYVQTEEGIPFKLSSGAESRYYFDTRLMNLNCKVAPKIANLFKQLICMDIANGYLPKDNLMIGGLETGALLLSTNIQNYMPINSFYVRKEEKEYGTQKSIVTPYTLDNKNIILIDDVLTTGQSLYKAYSEIKKYYPESHIARLYCLVDRSQEFNYDPFYHFNCDELLSRNTGAFFIYDSEEDFINLIKPQTKEVKI